MKLLTLCSFAIYSLLFLVAPAKAHDIPTIKLNTDYVISTGQRGIFAGYPMNYITEVSVDTVPTCYLYGGTRVKFIAQAGTHYLGLIYRARRQKIFLPNRTHPAV